MTGQNTDQEMFAAVRANQRMLSELVAKVEEVQVCQATMTEVLDNGLKETVENLERVVMGDEDMGVPPLRITVNKLVTAGNKAKWWLAGAVGVLSLPDLIRFIQNLVVSTP